MAGNQNTFSSFGYIPTSAEVNTTGGPQPTYNIGMPPTGSQYSTANGFGIQTYSPVEGFISGDTVLEGSQFSLEVYNFRLFTPVDSDEDFNANTYAVPYNVLELEGIIFDPDYTGIDFFRINFILDIPDPNNIASTPVTFAENLITSNAAFNFLLPSISILEYSHFAGTKNYVLRLGIGGQAAARTSYMINYTFM